MGKKILFLIVILLLAIVLRISNLDHVYVGDESYWPYLINYQLEHGFSFENELPKDLGQLEKSYWLDLPLTGLIYVFYSFIVGAGVVKLRLIGFIFAIGNILLVYALAKKLFTRKAALVSAFFMSISYWHLFLSSMVERDGSFMTFFYLISILLYLRYRETGSNMWLYSMGFILGISFLLKSSAVFISAVIISFVILDQGWKIWNYKWKDVKKISRTIIVVVIFDLIFYGGLMFFTYFFSNQYYQTMFSHAVPVDLFKPSFLSFFREIGYVLLWGSPLLAGLSFLSMKQGGKNKKYLISWFIIVMLGYVTLAYGGSIDRYLSVLIPVLSILAGTYISTIKFEKTYYKYYLSIFASIFGLYYLFLNVIATFDYIYITHSIRQYLINAVSFKWNFLFPFYGAGGPTFLVPFSAIGYSFIISAILPGMILVAKRYKKEFLIAFIAVTLAFTFFVGQEYNLHIHSIDISETVYESLKSFEHYDGVIYTNGMGMILGLNKEKNKIVKLDCEQKTNLSCWNRLNNTINAQGGRILYVDFPKRSEDSFEKRIIRSCLKEKKFDSHDIVSIYNCPSEESG